MPKTCADAIAASLAKLDRLRAEAGHPPGWIENHRRAFGIGPSQVDAAKPGAFEAAVSLSVKALALYADAHAARFGSPIGSDYVLGPLFAGWLSSLLGLLNGETGRLDCGTLDGLLREIGRRAGVVDENGEVRA